MDFKEFGKIFSGKHDNSNGQTTPAQAGSDGGQMVKKLIESQEKQNTKNQRGKKENTEGDYCGMDNVRFGTVIRIDARDGRLDSGKYVCISSEKYNNEADVIRLCKLETSEPTYSDGTVIKVSFLNKEYYIRPDRMSYARHYFNGRVLGELLTSEKDALKRELAYIFDLEYKPAENNEEKIMNLQTHIEDLKADNQRKDNQIAELEKKVASSNNEDVDLLKKKLVLAEKERDFYKQQVLENM